MSENSALNQIVRALFEAQPVGILATQSDRHPYCNIVAFTPSDDLRSILIATPRFTSKYRNMLKHPGVCFMIDNRSPQNPDFTDGIAVTCIGRAVTVLPEEFEDCKRRHFERHKNLRAHLDMPDCVLVRIEVERYVIARGVRQIETLSMI
ncbi:MAG: pyridoxamine 5'-phosphate oxidase family protein [Deltaproteobacteria bacterium]|nr:pyridoxamine 5'-phosphate oxidase family protein [Deltaproteobacteria bacterium]